MIIKCPKCGEEYRLEEILYPLCTYGNTLYETYECDQCNQKFSVSFEPVVKPINSKKKDLFSE